MESQDYLMQKLEEWQRLVLRHSMHGHFHYARSCGLSMPQLITLFQLHRSRHCGVGKVGEELGVTSAAASQMLDRLVQLGLVERREDPEDRRGKVISLAPEGERIVRGGLEEQRDWRLALAEAFPPEEAREAALVLDKLIQRALSLAPDPSHQGQRPDFHPEER